MRSTYPDSWPSQLHSLFPETEEQKDQGQMAAVRVRVYPGSTVILEARPQAVWQNLHPQTPHLFERVALSIRGQQSPQSCPPQPLPRAPARPPPPRLLGNHSSSRPPAPSPGRLPIISVCPPEGRAMGSRRHVTLLTCLLQALLSRAPRAPPAPPPGLSPPPVCPYRP